MKGISEYISGIDYLVVLIYLIVLIAIGYWVSFIKKRKKNKNLFLAGNSLGATSIGRRANWLVGSIGGKGSWCKCDGFRG